VISIIFDMIHTAKIMRVLNQIKCLLWFYPYQCYFIPNTSAVYNYYYYYYFLESWWTH